LFVRPLASEGGEESDGSRVELVHDHPAETAIEAVGLDAQTSQPWTTMPARIMPEATRSPVSDEAISELFLGLLRRTHLSAASDLAEIVAAEAAGIGAQEVVLYLADFEQATLVPLSSQAAPHAQPQSVGGTVAGRAFATTSVVTTSSDMGHRQRVWLPLLDGTERLGVMEMSFDCAEVGQRTIEVCERYAHLVAMLVVTKGMYSDVFEVARRRRPATIAADLARTLAPPLVFAIDGLTVASLLEPCYDNGGDALDYALNGRILHVGVFDAMGHGLAAVGVAAFAISAYRNSRRRGCDLLETHGAMNEAVEEQFPDRRFVTAVIAELDLDSGDLAWVSAGHPPPLLIRGTRRARTLHAPAATPLGVGLPGRPPTVSHTSLEPGDLVLFYTDGLTDARDQDGRRFGTDGLSRFIEREASAGHPAPETLRRLRQALVRREQARLGDDATALLVEWRRDTERALVPQTVL
jgi:serine phosphatase RsbU (regulator of sigma subunit)